MSQELNYTQNDLIVSEKLGRVIQSLDNQNGKIDNILDIVRGQNGKIEHMDSRLTRLETRTQYVVYTVICIVFCVALLLGVKREYIKDFIAGLV